MHWRLHWILTGLLVSASTNRLGESVARSPLAVVRNFLLFDREDFCSLFDYSSSVKVIPRSLSRIIPVRRM